MLRKKLYKKHIQSVLMMVLMLHAALFVTACGASDVKEFVTMVEADRDTLDDMSDPSGQRQYDKEIDKYKTYYDEKSGETISEVQYKAYTFTDAFKKYGLYVAIPCACIGFLIRRLVKSSASLRKLGLVLEVAIPLVYIVLAYVISAIADAV